MTTPALAFRHRVPVHYYARFNGLPLVYFGDGPQVDTSGGGPFNDLAYCAALRVSDQQISAQIENGAPVGQGRALDLVLDADTLAASGVYASHFTAPTKITATTAAVPIAATTIAADSTADFASSGAFYWGHERITYSGKTATSFTGCTRGTGAASAFLNYASAAPAGITGTWGLISDKPVLWRGRLVEIWAVAATPEGDLLGQPFTAGDASWRVWVGHVDGQPVIVPTGISIRALPAERSADREYGWGMKWEHAPGGADKWYQRLLYWPDGGKMRLVVTKDTGGTISKYTVDVEPLSGVAATSTKRVITPRALFDLAEPLWEADAQITSVILSYADKFKTSGVDDKILKVIAGDPIYMKVISNGATTKKFGVQTVGAAGGLAALGGVVLEYPDGAVYEAGILGMPTNSVMGAGGFFVLQPEEASDQIFSAPPVAGQFLRWESDGRQFIGEVARVLELSSGFPGAYFVNIKEMVVDQIGNESFSGGTDPINIAEVLYITGGAMTLTDIWKRILNTSGGALILPSTAGAFGASDLLPIGWGARIPDPWISATFADGTAEPAPDPFISYDLDARALFIDAVALKLAITQKFTSAGAVVDLAPMFAPQEADPLVEITTADLMADPIGVGPRDKPPNVVEIEFFSESKPKIVIRNPLRVHAEGTIKKETFKVPDHWANDRLTGVIQSVTTPDQLLSDVYIYELSVTPEKAWSVNPGDKLKINGRHYAFADFAAGSHRASSITGRVLGVTRKLDGSGGTIQIGVWGQVTADYYAPDSRIVSFNAGTNTVTFPAAQAAWFWAGSGAELRFYRPGVEDTKQEEHGMVSSTGATITFDALPAWLDEDFDRVTFPTYTAASTRQKNWAYTNDSGILS